MQTTMTLLERALRVKTPPEWARELGLERTALHNAKRREHLSPAVAGAIADKLGEDVNRWIVIAALESEKDSACKTHLLRRIAKWLLRNGEKRAKNRQPLTPLYA
jgi:hypothetical protein